MTTLEVTSRQFHNNQKTYFDLADKGRLIIIKRNNNRSYILTPNVEENSYFTTEMQEKIEKAMKQIENGECIEIKNKEELHKYFENL